VITGTTEGSLVFTRLCQCALPSDTLVVDGLETCTPNGVHGCSVHTTRDHGPWTPPVFAGSQRMPCIHPWVRPVFTGRIHGCSVHYHIRSPSTRPVFTGV